MTEMQASAMLTMLKTDLGIMTNAFDGRLGEYLRSAEAEITREGATPDYNTLNDCQLTVMYAAWMWRRRDTMEGMPRMLRYQLNNRIFKEKAANG